MKKVFSILIKIFKNKFVLSFLAFTVWVTFFDGNDLLTKYKSLLKLRELKKEKEYYFESIKADRKQIHELKTDVKNLEKFAREQYLMKKKNEDVFIIINKKTPTQKES